MYNYDINKLDKEKIKQEIEKLSSKSDKRKTLSFRQLSDKELYNQLEEFNKNNNKLAKDINNICFDKKINCKDIIKDTTKLIKQTETISKSLKCNIIRWYAIP